MASLLMSKQGVINIALKDLMKWTFQRTFVINWNGLKCVSVEWYAQLRSRLYINKPLHGQSNILFDFAVSFILFLFICYRYFL